MKADWEAEKADLQKKVVQLQHRDTQYQVISGTHIPKLKIYVA